MLRGFFFSADLGLIAFGIAQVVFFILPWLDRSDVVAPAHKRSAFFAWFWLLIADLIVLTIYGKLPPEGMNTYIGFGASIAFLFLMFVALPLIAIMERKKGGVK